MRLESWYHCMVKQKMYKNIILISLLPLGILLLYCSAFFPQLVESIYSRSFNKLVIQTLSLATGIVPVSVAEFALALIAIYILWKLIGFIIGLFKQRQGKLNLIKRLAVNLVIAASLIYFGFVLLWGLNYNRLPFAQIASLDVHPSSVDELSGLCSRLIDRANKLRNSIPESPKGVFLLKDGCSGSLKRAYKGYINAGKTYPELSGNYGDPKGVTFSRFMSYTGISGIYFPFTGEANVDIDMPQSMIPCTACHEMAHQRGFAREDEANYIAYLTCSMHPDIDFQYSGTLLALIHSTNALYAHDREKFLDLRKKYSSGVVRDLAENNEYWQQFEGSVEKVSNKINNTYLKANGQKDGVNSYGRMVDLLLAEYRKGKT